jgi:Carboxypeptidase regulatory-like domain
VLCCLSLVAAFAFSVVAPAIGSADGTGGISGTVSGEGGGTLEGVDVCASSSASPSTQIACQTTNSAGTYEITGLAAGQYIVEFTPPALGEYLTGSNSDVMVTAEAVTTGVDATLAKKPPPAPTKITGTVTGEGSGPLEGVEVCLYVYSGHGAPIECKPTDSSGSYEFAGMAPGQYTVEFTPPGPAEYFSQFYLEAASASAATPVVVTAETVTSNVDATLAKRPPSGPAKISGTVTTESGAPVAGVKVCVQQVGGAGPLCELTDSIGDYVFAELPTGEWGVTFNAQATGKNLLSLAYPNKEIWEPPAPVTLTPGQKEVISVALRTGGQISGTVRSAATGAPATGVRVCLTEADFFASLACLTTPSTGAYRFIDVWPGSFKVVFSAAASEFPDASPIADTYTTQWWNGQPTFGTAVPIVVTPPGAITGIDASLVTPSAPTTTSAAAAGGAVAAASAISKKPKCHKGYTSRKLKGKLRCVKVKQHHKKKSHAKHKKSA